MSGNASTDHHEALHFSFLFTALADQSGFGCADARLPLCGPLLAIVVSVLIETVYCEGNQYTLASTGMRRYEQVVSYIRRRIEAGTLKPGERLPSVRALSESTAFSMVTVHHGYALLESEGIIEARPRAGFFVAASAPQARNFADTP